MCPGASVKDTASLWSFHVAQAVTHRAPEVYLPSPPKGKQHAQPQLFFMLNNFIQMQNQNNNHSTKIHIKINKQYLSLAYIFALTFNK